ncbi:hypothetical protein PDO_0060 [Rhizobium sp. PDO1-076]|uniref:hypothetical protein n=1 Tax=Rhizobium sp. PDO1-076 TaxID=1125979 RepID=UPI00024E276E|nr:hypothetical protein [Rhizobium sp. PDO1-076]EHS52432.1 hypothetical protein PDO_0060 [Rhizobium sp. PDO1-076]
MNKIVRDHYPVENLPADLREGLDDQATVRVVIEVEAAAKPEEPLKKRSIQETLDDLEQFRRGRTTDPNIGEAVSRIRALRDEWDDE